MKVGKPKCGESWTLKTENPSSELSIRSSSKVPS
jgi:hypothetical protein